MRGILLDGSRPAVDATDAAAVASAMSRAAGCVAGALSLMSNRTIEAADVQIAWVPVTRIPLVSGNPEQSVFAVYLGVTGELGVATDVRGHIVLALSETMAFGLIDLLLGQPEGTTHQLGPLEISALAEAGNVAGSAFLNSLADSASLTLPPTPPLVFHEMFGAILDTLAAELIVHEQDDVMVIETRFTCDDQTVDVAFLLFPAPAMAQTIIRAAVGEVERATGSA